MKKNFVLLAVAGAFALGGCYSSTVVRNTANAECDRRVQTDRERCERNNRSSDEALAATGDAKRAAKESWAEQTLERLQDAGAQDRSSSIRPEDP